MVSLSDCPCKRYNAVQEGPSGSIYLYPVSIPDRVGAVSTRSEAEALGIGRCSGCGTPGEIAGLYGYCENCERDYRAGCDDAADEFYLRGYNDTVNERADRKLRREIRQIDQFLEAVRDQSAAQA